MFDEREISLVSKNDPGSRWRKEGVADVEQKKDLSRLVLSLGKKTETLPCGEKERERRMLKKRWKNREEWKEKRRRRKRVVAKQVLAVSSTLLQLSLFDASSGHPL